MQVDTRLNLARFTIFSIVFMLALAILSGPVLALSCPAQAPNQATTYQNSLILTTGTVNSLDGVSVYIMQSQFDKCSASTTQTVSSLQTAFQNFVTSQGVVDPANLNQLQSTLSNAPTAITSLSNVKVSKFYKKGSSQITLQCQNTGLSQLTINTPQVDSNGNPVTFTDSNGKVVPLYYGFCEVQKHSNGVNIYHGTCVDLIAEYFSTSGTATGSTRLCDQKQIVYLFSGRT